MDLSPQLAILRAVMAITPSPIPGQISTAGISIAGDAAGVLGRALASYEPRIIMPSTHVWRASVALVLRWTRHVPSAPTQPLHSFLRQHANALELLFIQRATQDGDPWSGHIAFPGGRREDADEGDLGCVVRETQEELGLDLSDEKQFRLLGRLDDEAIPVTRRGRRGGVMSSFVLLQKSPEGDEHDAYEEDTGAPIMTLDASEVAACLWVPVKCLLADSGARTTHAFSISPRRLGFVGQATPQAVLRLLGLLRINYTAVDVVAECTEIVYAEGGGENGDSSLKVVKDSEPANEDRGPVLWGMSFRAASDLVQVLGGTSHVANRPVFVFDNRILTFVHRSVYRVACVVRRRISFVGRMLNRKRHRC